MVMEKMDCEVVKAMELELERGHEFAKQLRQVLFESNTTYDHRVDEDVSSSSAEDLVANVVASFTNSLSLFNNNHNHPHPHEPSLHLSDPSKSDESRESSKSKSRSTSPIKHPRGCYKRRKSSDTWEKVSEKPEEDGRSWRKYGQKLILNSKFPRNYFRCTQKFDQGCQATKQVQKIQENPSLYKTTYYGHHTCRNLLDPEIIWDSHHHDDLHFSNPNSFILSFHNNNSSCNNNNNNTLFPHPNHNPFLSSSSSPSPSSSFLNISVKNEDQNNDMNNNNNNNNNNNISSSLYDDYVMHSFDELTFEYSDHRDVISSGGFYDAVHDGLDALLFDSFEF